MLLVRASASGGQGGATDVPSFSSTVRRNFLAVNVLCFLAETKPCPSVCHTCFFAYPVFLPHPMSLRDLMDVALADPRLLGYHPVRSPLSWMNVVEHSRNAVPSSCPLVPLLEMVPVQTSVPSPCPRAPPPPYDTFTFWFSSILDAGSVFAKRKRRFGKTDEQVATR